MASHGHVREAVPAKRETALHRCYLFHNVVSLYKSAAMQGEEVVDLVAIQLRGIRDGGAAALEELQKRELVVRVARV